MALGTTTRSALLAIVVLVITIIIMVPLRIDPRIPLLFLGTYLHCIIHRARIIRSIETESLSRGSSMPIVRFALSLPLALVCVYTVFLVIAITIIHSSHTGVVDILARCTSTIPVQCRCSTGAVPVPYQRSTSAVPMQYPCSTHVVPMQYPCTASAAPVQHPCRTSVLHQYQRTTRSAPAQTNTAHR